MKILSIAPVLGEEALTSGALAIEGHWICNKTELSVYCYYSNKSNKLTTITQMVVNGKLIGRGKATTKYFSPAVKAVGYFPVDLALKDLGVSFENPQNRGVFYFDDITQYFRVLSSSLEVRLKYH